MTEAVATASVAIPKVGKTLAVALLMGLSIQLIGTLSWVALIRLNMREHPDLPWAAATQACLLVLMLVWLSGHGWPRRTSAFRRFHLRLWQPQPGAWSGDRLATILGLIGALVGLSVLYVLIAASRPPVDVSAYSTALRWSSLLMSPMVAGVVEEMAFRGYMQRHLERIGPTFAILVTSAVFTLLHATQGLTREQVLAELMAAKAQPSWAQMRVGATPARLESKQTRAEVEAELLRAQKHPTWNARRLGAPVSMD